MRAMVENTSSRDLPREILCQYGMTIREIDPYDLQLAPFSDIPVYASQTCKPEAGVVFLSDTDARRYYEQVYPDMLRTWIEKGSDPRHLFVGSPAGQKILDFGCGTGQMTAKLAKTNRLHGVDIAPSLLQEASACGLLTQVVDIDRELLPFPDGTFDMVYSFDVLEHVFSVPAALRELSRVLKPKGVLLMTTPVMQPDTMENNEIFHRSTVEQLGIHDALAHTEPEVNIHHYYEWLDLLTEAEFSLLTRPIGYEWDVSVEQQLAYMRGLPANAPNVFLMAQKNSAYAIHPINWRIGNGAWSFPEMHYDYGKIASSEALVQFLRQP